MRRKDKTLNNRLTDDLGFIEQVKRLAIIAMFSDDDLMERLVLKGGNAINLIYQINKRSSIDIDFSMSLEFEKGELPLIEEKIVRVLSETFINEGYVAFDIQFEQRPRLIAENSDLRWGGYQIAFKIIEKSSYERFSQDMQNMRRNARVVGPNQQKTFYIDISKFEFCEGKNETDLGGYTIYVYSPLMLVFEKVRAICQQMPEYKTIVPSARSFQRARDFFDIYVIMDNFQIDLANKKNIELLQTIFETKHVPLQFLRLIRNSKEFHRTGFESLQDTVTAGFQLKDFDFYVDFVADLFERIPD